MLALGRTVIMLAVGLTVIYLCLFFYLRSGARMRLEEDWVRAGRPGDRGDWVDARLAPQMARVRRWLAVVVYALPILGAVTIIWATN